jgi:predicted amidohydrolase YtcJ
MKALGLQAYIQPIFIEADMCIITQRVGEKRAKDCYNWRSMLEMGIPVSGGSDCPVEPFDVLDNLRAAVTRQDRAGERTYLPQQALSLEEGLSLFTSRAAWASRDENVRGQLRPGMQGDLVILDGDLFAVSPQELPKVPVFETVLAGKTVFTQE